jgi:hypothetical protein
MPLKLRKLRSLGALESERRMVGKYAEAQQQGPDPQSGNAIHHSPWLNFGIP